MDTELAVRREGLMYAEAGDGLDVAGGGELWQRDEAATVAELTRLRAENDGLKLALGEALAAVERVTGERDKCEQQSDEQCEQIRELTEERDGYSREMVKGDKRVYALELERDEANEREAIASASFAEVKADLERVTGERDEARQTTLQDVMREAASCISIEGFIDRLRWMAQEPSALPPEPADPQADKPEGGE